MGAGPTIMVSKAAVDLAEEGGYILVSPMGYNTNGWYGSMSGGMSGMRGPLAVAAAMDAAAAPMPGGGFNAEFTANREKTDKPIDRGGGEVAYKRQQQRNKVGSQGRRLQINGNVRKFSNAWSRRT